MRKKNNISDDNGLRDVFCLNLRVKYIRAILERKNVKDGTLPLERKVAKLFLNDKVKFNELLSEANNRMGIVEPIENKTNSDSDTNLDLNTNTTSNTISELASCVLKLLEEYPGGININSALDTDRFCLQYYENNLNSSVINNSGIIKTLKSVGEMRDGRIYPPATDEKKHLMDDIWNEVKEILTRYSCVHLSSLFEKHRDKLAQQQIYDIDEFKNLISVSRAVKKCKKMAVKFCR